MPIATPHTALSDQPNQSQANGVNGHGDSAVAGTKNGTESGSSMVQEILARRAKAGKLVAGVAAASDSDMWKGPVSNGPPPPLKAHGGFVQQVGPSRNLPTRMQARWKAKGKTLGR
jgi:hypothetical protein